MQQAMYDIRTIDMLIDALGGDTAVAAWLNISQPAVANWKQRGVIPPGWHMRLFARVIGMGQTVDPAIFGLDGFPEFEALATKVGNGPEHGVAA